MKGGHSTAGGQTALFLCLFNTSNTHTHSQLITVFQISSNHLDIFDLCGTLSFSVLFPSISPALIPCGVQTHMVLMTPSVSIADSRSDCQSIGSDIPRPFMVINYKEQRVYSRNLLLNIK